MTKREYYFKDDITPNEAYDLLFEFVGYISLLPMNNQDDRINVYDKVMEFLNQNIKPVLTEDEKVILRKISKELKYIGRRGDEKHSFLYVCEKPRQPQDYYALMFEDVFDFIKPRRRI